MELWLVIAGAILFWLAAGIETIVAVKRRTLLSVCLCVLAWLLFFALAALVVLTLMFVTAIE